MNIARALPILALGIWGAGPEAHAFDTRWHSEATRSAAASRGFTEDANLLMQFGTFGPDFFGPMSDTVLPAVGTLLHEDTDSLALKPMVRQLAAYRDSEDTLQARKAGLFLHFDDLHDELNTNVRFALLFERLLHNTRATVRRLHADATLSAEQRQTAILLTLGASLHMVQDFYSHSNWAHLPRSPTRAPPVRVPTWFEACQGADCTASWKFLVQTGTWPAPETPPPGQGAVPKTHAAMHHDNSQLACGKDPCSQYHQGQKGYLGDNSPQGHQKLVSETAKAASVEWLRKVAENAEAARAVQFAGTWKRQDPALPWDPLDQAITDAWFFSCATGHWDGPAGNAEQRCESMLPSRISARLGVIVLKLRVVAPASNPFWSTILKHNLLEALTEGFSDGKSGHYAFPPPAAAPAPEKKSRLELLRQAGEAIR